MAGSNGTAGGYTVPPDQDEEQKGMRTKAPPQRGPKRMQDEDQDGYGDTPQGQGQDQQQQPQRQSAPQKKPQQPQQQPQQQQPGQMNGEGGGTDPKEVLGRLVDALTDYLEITGDKHDEPDGDEEPDEDDFRDDDMPDQDSTPMDDRQGDERYEFRSGRPRKTKRYHAAATVKKARACIKAAALHCKSMADMDEGDELTDTHKAACMHHYKELMDSHKDLGGGGEGDDEGGEDEDETMEAPSGADDGEHNDPSLKPVTKDEPDIDLAAVMRAFAPVRGRVTALENTWADLNGRMPE